jgi:tetratricopeptide (TPR) repeat protein
MAKPPDDPGGAYSHWFKLALPHRVDRQLFLQRLIKEAPITHANLRLAHLLIDGRISKLAITTNFDDLISRALALFGETHTVCDDPRTVERIDPEKRNDIQVVHVHGSHSFYNCSNTADEIDERAQSSPETTQTMAALLDRILSFRAPIVCGYSGWRNDVFMRALARRLRNTLPHNMYWFCFRRDEADTVKELLGEHPDVYYVVPSEGGPSESTGTEPAATSSGAVEGKAALHATEVFDALIRAVGAKTPPLINDPLSFYAAHLRGSLPKDDAGGRGDIYAFRTVVERVERAIEIEQEEIANRKKNDAEMEAIREAVRGARYDEVFSHIESIHRQSVTDEQLKELTRILETVGTATANTAPSTAIKASDAFFEYCSVLKDRGLSPEVAGFVSVAIAKGNVLYASKDYAPAIEAYDLGISRFSDSPDPETMRRIGVARNNVGLALRNLGRNSEAVAAHSLVIERLGGSSDPNFVDVLVSAHAFKGSALFNEGKLLEAIEAIATANRLAATLPNLTPYAKQNLASAELIQVQAEAKMDEARAASLQVPAPNAPVVPS